MNTANWIQYISAFIWENESEAYGFVKILMNFPLICLNMLLIQPYYVETTVQHHLHSQENGVDG